MWGLKPLLDVIVLLLTIHKSAKFKQTPRPVLIDILIADGMDSWAARPFRAGTDLVMQGFCTSCKGLHGRLTCVKPTHILEQGVARAQHLEYIFLSRKCLQCIPEMTAQRRSSIAGICTLKVTALIHPVHLEWLALPAGSWCSTNHSVGASLFQPHKPLNSMVSNRMCSIMASRMTLNLRDPDIIPHPTEPLSDSIPESEHLVSTILSLGHPSYAESLRSRSDVGTSAIPLRRTGTEGVD